MRKTLQKFQKERQKRFVFSHMQCHVPVWPPRRHRYHAWLVAYCDLPQLNVSLDDVPELTDKFASPWCMLRMMMMMMMMMMTVISVSLHQDENLSAG